jgi:hypothetical protein
MLPGHLKCPPYTGTVLPSLTDRQCHGSRQSGTILQYWNHGLPVLCSGSGISEARGTHNISSNTLYPVNAAAFPRNAGLHTTNGRLITGIINRPFVRAYYLPATTGTKPLSLISNRIIVIPISILKRSVMKLRYVPVTADMSCCDDALRTGHNLWHCVLGPSRLCNDRGLSLLLNVGVVPQHFGNPGDDGRS